MEFHFDPAIEEKIRLDNERERAEKARRLKLIPFDWQDLPRINWPHGAAHPKDFEGLKLKLANGQEISMQNLHQDYIYAGSLLGRLRDPTDYLLQAIEAAEQYYPHTSTPPLILPPSLFWGRKVKTINGADKSNEWISLPRMRCIAEFLSAKPAKNAAQAFSSLIVIWFQDFYGLPDDAVKAQLKSMDWEHLAHDWMP